MNPVLLTGLFDAIGKIAGRLWPDPAQQAAAQLELLKMQQAGELDQLNADLQLALAQASTNTAEAAAPDLFTRGWRPFCGWVCGLGLLYQFLLRPALIAFGKPAPDLDMGTLLTLLFGMLGLGAYRSVEKIKGAA